MAMRRAELIVCMSWDGRPIPESWHSRLALQIDGSLVHLELDAPFHSDPAPVSSPGRCPGLWKYEVVELFLAGVDDRYLELEFGPWGHYLALQLHGARNVVRDDIALDFDAEPRGDRWSGRCDFSAQWLPGGLGSWNAYSIHGGTDGREHCAAFPVVGVRPDFHRLDCFCPIPWSET
jgi:hypothetical protein